MAEDTFARGGTQRISLNGTPDVNTGSTRNNEPSVIDDSPSITTKGIKKVGRGDNGIGGFGDFGGTGIDAGTS